MTNTKVKKRKLYKRMVKIDLLNNISVGEMVLSLLGIFSALTAKENSFLCVTPIIIMMLCTERLSICICAGAAILFYITTVFKTAYYVPCMAFVAIYLIGYYILGKNNCKIKWFALAVYFFCKVYVLSFGYQPIYYTVFAAEVVSIMFLPQTVKAGVKNLIGRRQILTAMQLFESAAAFIVLAAALSGISVYGFNFSVWALFSAAIYFLSKDNIALSMTAFLCVAAIICQDKNFSLLFIGFFVIYMFSSAMLKQGIKGYISAMLTAVLISFLLITKFNSFVLITITSASLATVFAVNKFAPSGVCTYNENAAVGQDYLKLSNQIEKLNQCFNFLGHTVVDISNIINKEDIPKDISDMVAQKFCKKCKNNILCWQENYSYTQNQFSKFAYNIQNGNDTQFDSLLCSRCDKIAELSREFYHAYSLEHTKQLINRSGKHNQEILQNQFFIIAKVLQDITQQAVCSGAVNTAYTHNLNNFLMGRDKLFEYGICYHNKSKCVVAAKEIVSTIELDRIRMKIENIYGEKFSDAVLSDNGEEILYTFSSVPKFEVTFAAHSKSLYNVCGDICHFFKTEDRAFVILADGMGTGSFAAAESRTALTMLENLISSGINIETALDITNTALNLKGTGQSCVAVDILQFDCSNGECSIYKAGAAESLFINKNKIKSVYKESLPIGILKDTKTEKISFTIEGNGCVILLSDGIHIKSEFADKINLMATKLIPNELAEFIVKSSAQDDDATAAVCHIKLI